MVEFRVAGPVALPSIPELASVIDHMVITIGALVERDHATIERLLHEVVGDRSRVKAAGGIRTLDELRRRRGEE